MTASRIEGLVAAVHTPFHADGTLNLACVERQARHLDANGVRYAFVGGTTGESSSLSLEERLALGRRWIDVAKGSAIEVIVHVGANSLADATTLARDAQARGAAAISAIAPTYFRPATVPLLVDCMAEIAAAAPALPFYYYEIPALTSIPLSPSAFLVDAAARIPTLAGIKFSSSNLMEYQLCRAAGGAGIDLPFGIDEMLLGALAVGAVGAVGSSYNFAAPVYQALLAAFRSGDLDTARQMQLRSVRLIQLLASRGYMGAAKATLAMLGVDVGPARLPNASLSQEQAARLRTDLERLGFFDWVAPR